MKSKMFCSLMVVATLTGCVTVTIRDTPIGEAHGSAAGAFLLRCTGERWVGRLPRGASKCPADEQGQFDVTPLFTTLEVSRDLLKLAQNAGLDRYCLYTTDGRPGTPRVQGLEGLDVDCRAVQTMGGPVSVKNEQLAAQTLAAIGRRPSGPAAGHVRLSFLDTVPDTEAPKAPVPSDGALCSRHGDSLERLARAVACGATPEVPCPVGVYQRLALPEGGPEGCEGGTHGFISQIAQALWKELAAWDAGSPQPRDRLVLNLSLGWDGRLYGGFEDHRTMPERVRAVYDALEVARRRGSLVVAAAGNLTLGESATGPLLPAGWERRHPCSPRVFAVSGLDVEGRPLYNSRPGALARHGAFGGPAVVELASGGFTPALTGSSVATAVVSALAAATWARHPEDSAASLVRRLEHGGRRLRWRADSVLAKGRPGVFHLAPGIRLQAGPGEPHTPVAVHELPVFSNGPFTPLHPAYDQAESQPQPSSTPCPNCSVDPPLASAMAAGSLLLAVELADDWNWKDYRVTLDALQIRAGDESFHARVQLGPWPNYQVGPGASTAFELRLDAADAPDRATRFDAVLLYWTVEKRTGATTADWAVAGEVVSQAIFTK